MFEDSLIESQGRIRTKSKWFAIASVFAQASLLLLLILYPLVHPEALPQQSMERLLVAPPPPHSPAPVQAHTAATSSSRQQVPSLEAQLRAPRAIPTRIAAATDPAPPTVWALNDTLGAPGLALPGGAPSAAGPPVVLAKPPVPKGPVKVSTGVAQGLLLAPIRPLYPAIAKAARIQGTVIIEATISRQGTIENLRVTEGPPMLRQAAIDAVSAAQYHPFLLNGEAVEVQTSIRVIFSLEG